MKGKLKQSMSRDPVLRRAAISWARSGELTPQRLWPVLRALGGVEALLSSSEEELTKRLESGTKALAVLRSAEDVSSEKWVTQLERAGVRVVTAFDEEYPDALAEISDPPFLLFAAGNLERLRLPAVGIVGSRAATRYGRDVAARLARELSAAGITIVSGFARGVDESAHQAALGAPGGTIAVLGCRLEVDYPREHAALKEAMRARDLLLSEFPPGTEPMPTNFPVRNRIIAGLCAGVVVVEASRRSGSLITARLANEFGRDVFAVPGSVFSPTSIGTHALLRDGAILCRGAEDVLAELFPTIGTAPAGKTAAAASAVGSLSGEAPRGWERLPQAKDGPAADPAAAAGLPPPPAPAPLFQHAGARPAVPGR